VTEQRRFPPPSPPPPSPCRYNVQSGEATWDNPYEPLPASATTALAPFEQNREQWVSYFDENTGQEYWYNVETGETSWSAT
jgi:hypothetical protein